ncbi:carbohydrate kinase [Microbacterium aoyamense]|uniref:Carbohydrate kinase n=1 Tax=Microbacterium aoyamense TaxID=344166 RepID=A0ABP5ALR8_9MICO|nr:PfkB family carbohydrate kinase [Microbacterium aoyamense]
MTGRAVVIGDALIDELRDTGGVREFVGGAALNVAVGLSRLGVPSSLIAMVGDDEAGDRIRSYLDDYGVELIATVGPHGSSRAVSIRSASGEPTYEFNDAAWNRAVDFAERERAAIADAAIVVVSCFPFDDLAQTAALAEAAGGSRLAIDPNPRSGMLHDRERFVTGFESVVPGATLAKVGEDDAALLYGEPLDLLRTRLIDLGAEAVLATYGSSGAAIDAGQDAVTAPISGFPGRIVDTMGGGDAAFASTIASLLAGRDDWSAVLHEAMDVAAATCRFEGALLRLPSALERIDIDAIGT